MFCSRVFASCRVEKSLLRENWRKSWQKRRQSFFPGRFTLGNERWEGWVDSRHPFC